MNFGKVMTKVIPLLMGMGFLLGACTVDTGYAAPTYPYAYGDPVYGSLDFDYGGWGGWHHDHDHGHWAHGGGHGFGGHAGAGGHGGHGGGHGHG